MSKLKFPRANNEISVEKVRLIDSSGNPIGIVSLTQALQTASSANLDLVEVSPNASPPVCKILDFGKYKYEIQKKAHEAKKKQKTMDVKEIKLRPNIGEHDYEIKLKHIVKFINDGNKVKISMRFRGREIVKQDIAKALMQKTLERLTDIAKAEVEPKMEGRQLLMIITPN